MVDRFKPGDRAFLKFTIDAVAPTRECILAFIVQVVTDGQTLCDYNLPLARAQKSDNAGPCYFVIEFDVNLLRGMYSILLNLYHSPTSTFLIRRLNAGLFSVRESRSYAGVTHLNPVIEISERMPCTKEGNAIPRLNQGAE